MESDNKIYVSKTNDVPALDKKKLWEFKPSRLKVGDHITGGDIFGTVNETSLMPRHGIMLHPNESGRITYIAPEGEYTIQDEVLKIEGIGYAEKSFTMMHKWPVRTPRPVVEKLSFDQPVITGERVFDAIFPVARGGTCAIPSVRGAGLTGALFYLQKHSNPDVLVHVAVGERGNDISELLLDLPEVKTFSLVPGAREPLMNRTCIYGNVTNMPLGSREAAVYSGVTTAEYFRDQGFNVCYIADSTSRWAEAMREIYNFTDMPSSQGYPPWIGSRLATFYDRSGRATCLGNPSRVGSLTMVATVGCWVGDDYELDHFASSTLSTCQTFWGLDRSLARIKHFPPVNYMLSYSHYLKSLSSYFDNVSSDFVELRNKIMELLEKETTLLDTVKVIGKDSLGDQDLLVLEVAKIIREDFMQQNAFTPYDQFSPLYKTLWMMRNIVAFYTQAFRAIERGKPWKNKIKPDTSNLLFSLTRMKFKDPHDGEDTLVANYQELNRDIYTTFSLLFDQD